jgi:hypothetical protein
MFSGENSLALVVWLLSDRNVKGGWHLSPFIHLASSAGPAGSTQRDITATTKLERRIER